MPQDTISRLWYGYKQQNSKNDWSMLGRPTTQWLPRTSFNSILYNSSNRSRSRRANDLSSMDSHFICENCSKMLMQTLTSLLSLTILASFSVDVNETVKPSYFELVTSRYLDTGNSKAQISRQIHRNTISYISNWE